MREPPEARVSAEENAQVVQQLFGAYACGDMQAMLALLADDVVWEEPGPPELLPLAGMRRTREQVASWFALLDELEDVLEFEARQFIPDEDQVVVLGNERVRVRSTSRVYVNEWAMVFTVRDGRIARMRAYHDTAAMVAAYQQ
jgi:uncharacterized protein